MISNGSQNHGWEGGEIDWLNILLIRLHTYITCWVHICIWKNIYIYKESRKQALEWKHYTTAKEFFDKIMYIQQQFLELWVDFTHSPGGKIIAPSTTPATRRVASSSNPSISYFSNRLFVGASGFKVYIPTQKTNKCFLFPQKRDFLNGKRKNMFWNHWFSRDMFFFVFGAVLCRLSSFAAQSLFHQTI